MRNCYHLIESKEFFFGKVRYIARDYAVFDSLDQVIVFYESSPAKFKSLSPLFMTENRSLLIMPFVFAVRGT